MKPTWVNDDVRENTTSEDTRMDQVCHVVWSMSVWTVVSRSAALSTKQIDANKSAMFRLSKASRKTDLFRFFARQIRINWKILAIKPSDPVTLNIYASFSRSRAILQLETFCNNRFSTSGAWGHSSLNSYFLPEDFILSYLLFNRLAVDKNKFSAQLDVYLHWTMV